MKIKKKMKRGSGGAVGSGAGWGVRVDVNEELKFLRKFTKKSGGWGVRVGGGQGGCQRRIEVFVKIQKKMAGGGGLGVGLVGSGLM